ncbi:fimbrial protein [Lelliottia sp. CFBP8978]|uniref:fimbrial protein n=1 Tax=Lelliottia sp. CFBP8978 TaxID=3096522 RepID=UPI002A6B3389|nr:fimbrial protein [Lelliottia sp. CFBP8978]MDY1036760.1 fimbrial protein [Lelliottia sp. CFBP8978]
MTTFNLLGMNLKMKKLPCAAALLFLSVSTAHALDPDTKDFEATGKITEKGCMLEPSQPVAITSVSFKELASSGTVETDGPGANATMFTLTATNCSGGQVQASVVGTPDATDSKLLAIDSTAGAAENVALAFGTESPSTDGNIFLPLNDGLADPTDPDPYKTDHEFFFFAEVVKTAQTAVPGTVHATAQLHITYL